MGCTLTADNEGIMTSENILLTQNLSVYYGSHRGIKDLNLNVKKGEIFGYLGPNGAGKTTTLRAILNIIHPTRGSAHLFGLNSKRDGIAIRDRLSYLPGELRLYPPMRADSYFDFLGSLHKRRPDKTFLADLIERLDLDPSRKMKEYSHGNKQKIGIVTAFMGKKELIILDEPTIGLDPIAQQTVLDLIKDVKKEGRTVFLSSHNLKEVQTVCDRVVIIQNGEMIKTEKVETLVHQPFRRLTIRFRREPPLDVFAMPGVKEKGRNGNRVELEVHQGLEELMAKAVSFGIADIETTPISLEEIFLAYYSPSHQGDVDV